MKKIVRCVLGMREKETASFMPAASVELVLQRIGERMLFNLKHIVEWLVAGCPVSDGFLAEGFGQQYFVQKLITGVNQRQHNTYFRAPFRIVELLKTCTQRHSRWNISNA